MINLNQVKELEVRVKKAVLLIKSLSEENHALKKQQQDFKTNLNELRQDISQREANEEHLLAGLQDILVLFDDLESKANTSMESIEKLPIEEILLSEEEKESLIPLSSIEESKNSETPSAEMAETSSFSITELQEKQDEKWKEGREDLLGKLPSENKEENADRVPSEEEIPATAVGKDTDQSEFDIF